MFVWVGLSPLATRIGPFPGSSSRGRARGSLLSRPPNVTQLAGLWAEGARALEAQADNRGAEAGAGSRAGSLRPGSRAAAAPGAALPPWGMGSEAAARLPGRAVPPRCGPAAEEGGRQQRIVAGRARDPPCEQDPGSLTAPSPSAPFPGPSPPGASPRPPPASPGPYLSPPWSPRLRPPPHARLGCAHGRLTLCRRRSCCRPDRRRYRSPPFAVSAPRGTRVNEEGPRNITPPRPAAGAVRSAA